VEKCVGRWRVVRRASRSTLRVVNATFVLKFASLIVGELLSRNPRWYFFYFLSFDFLFSWDFSAFH
jgi:hypothetical protein